MALLRAYGFNDNAGTTAADSSGNGLTLTISPATWTAGHGGSPSAVKVTNSHGFIISAPPTGSPYTIMAWVRLDALPSGWVSAFDSGNPQFGWVEFSGTGALDWYSDNGGALNGPSFTAGAWRHLAITASGTTRTLYVDGISVASVASTALAVNEAISYCAGANNDAGSMSMDDLRIFNTALVQTEIATYMNTSIGGAAVARSGGSTSAVAVHAQGAGMVPSQGRTGGSTGHVTTIAQGSGTARRRGGSTAGVSASAQGAGHVPGDYRFPATVSGRNLLDGQGDPWFARGDAPWSAPVDLSTSQWETWCSNRETNGFNAGLFSMVGSVANGGPNNDGQTFDGIQPFVGGDITQPNESYWARMDTFIETAKNHGITLFAYPIDWWVTENGVFAGEPDAACTTYGAFIGNRYGHQPNLVWMVGGDYPPGGAADSKFNAVLTAIRATESRWHPRSIQLYYRRSWSTQNSFWRDKVDFNFVYSYYPQYEAVRGAWADKNIPAIFCEGNYFGENSFAADTTTETIRRQAGWALASGSRGDFIGTADWDFDSGWETRLNLTSVTEVKKMRDLVQSLAGWHELEPSETFLASGAGTAYVYQDGVEVDVLDNSRAVASVTTDGTLALTYLPTSRAVTLNTALLGDEPTGTWVNASTGTPTSANLGSLTPPSAGDWFLIVQAQPVTQSASGGSTAPLLVGASGSGRKVARGGSTASLVTDASGTGRKLARGSSIAPVEITANSAGLKLARAGAVVTAIITATGGGRPVQPGVPSGGSPALVGVATSGLGSKRAAGGSTAGTFVTVHGAGRNPSAWSDIEVIIARGPYGNALTISPRR